jgi:type II secretory pathway pseudopilin PulG
MMKISCQICAPGVLSVGTRRAAYTMLELMIAVGLTSLLMIALFAALQQYFSLQLDSNEEITRQQIARALLRQMTRDIQSVVFVKKLANDEKSGTSTSVSGGGSSSSGFSSGGSSSSGSSSGAGTSGGTGSSSTTSGSSSSISGALDGNSYGQSSIDPETVMTTYTNGLVGTASDLQLFVSRPEKSLAYVASQDLTSTSQRTSDLMIIRYLMAQSGGGLASAIAQKETVGTESGPVGIAKLEGDLFGLSTAVETSEESPQLAASKLLAKEVSGLQFRYYDGLGWQESWDSNALNELPKAIEITLTLRNQEDAGEAFSDDVADPYALPETTHRMVVPIPVAEPFVTESAL